MEILDIIVNIASIISTLAIIVIFITLIYTKKQLFVSTITSCNSRFQNILIKLNDIDKTNDRETIIYYIDLCNEELFYCKYGFVPKTISLEWLQGMFYFLPHYVNGCDVNENSLLKYLQNDNSNIIEFYPRIKKTFEFCSKQYEVIISEKTNLHAYDAVYNKLKNIKE